MPLTDIHTPGSPGVLVGGCVIPVDPTAPHGAEGVALLVSTKLGNGDFLESTLTVSDQVGGLRGLVAQVQDPVLK